MSRQSWILNPPLRDTEKYGRLDSRGLWWNIPGDLLPFSPLHPSALPQWLPVTACLLHTVEEEHAIQMDLFVYSKFHSRYKNNPSDSQETSFQTYTHVFSLEVKMVEILAGVHVLGKFLLMGKFFKNLGTFCFWVNF